MKRLGKNWLLPMACGAIMALTACTDGKESVASLNERIDSLQTECDRKDDDMKDMMSFVGVLADGLDSIAKHENVLFFTNKGPEGTIVDREQLKQNLEMFENTLNSQRERIATLVDSLKQRGKKLDKLNNLVNYLNAQLDEKNEIIAQLRSDLNNKNLSIAQLQRRVQALADDNAALGQKVEAQREALTVQSDIINECYVKIGTKKALTDLGIISGGFLKKTKVNVDALNKDQFMKVDIRNFTEVPINSGSPKILTAMPASSYRIESHGGTSTLYITDPTEFWSVSNFLVIMTK